MLTRCSPKQLRPGPPSDLKGRVPLRVLRIHIRARLQQCLHSLRTAVCGRLGPHDRPTPFAARKRRRSVVVVVLVEHLFELQADERVLVAYSVRES